MTKQLLITLGLAAALIAGCAGTKEVITADSEQETKSSRTEEPPSDAVLDHAIAGASYEAQGEYMLALHEYNRGLLRDSTRTELYHAAAEMHTRLGEPESALLLLQDGVRLIGEPSLYTHLGEIQLQMDMYEDAASTFRTLLELEPDNTAAMQHLATALERSGKPAEALIIYNELLEEPDVEAEPILMRKVSLLSAQKKYDEAIEVYEELQEHRPQEDRIPFFIGGLYLDMGDTTKAIESISAAARMRPVEPRYWDLLIRLEMVRGEEERAVALADTAVSYNPSSPDILGLAASVFSITDHHDKAEEILKRAIELEPASSEHLLNLGYLYHEQGDFESAAKLYEDALKLSPGDPQILNNYAYLLAEWEKDLEHALELSEDALSMEPENPSFLDTKGWILFHLERFDEARTWLERAHELDPDHYEILEHLGDLYAAMGMKEMAKEKWQQAIDAGGDSIEISRKLEE